MMEGRTCNDNAVELIENNHRLPEESKHSVRLRPAFETLLPGLLRDHDSAPVPGIIVLI